MEWARGGAPETKTEEVEMAQMARIDLRMDERQKQAIVRAAELTRSNVTQFILDRVVPEAERIVAEEEHSRIQLGADDWTAFCARLDAAPRDLPNMRALLSRPGRFVEDDERP
jgi:uncharacterized protein (DUF1778 family)